MECKMDSEIHFANIFYRYNNIHNIGLYRRNF